MSEFARGARVRPKQSNIEAVSISAQVPLVQFFAVVGLTAVQDYGIRDREDFLHLCGLAFDSALKAGVFVEGKPT